MNNLLLPHVQTLEYSVTQYIECRYVQHQQTRVFVLFFDANTRITDFQMGSVSCRLIVLNGRSSAPNAFGQGGCEATRPAYSQRLRPSKPANVHQDLAARHVLLSTALYYGDNAFPCQYVRHVPLA